MNLTLEQLMEMLGRQAAPMPAVNPTGIPSAPTSGLLADAITLPPVEVMPDNMDVDMSPEMMKYCVKDVQLNTMVFKQLRFEAKGFSKDSIKLEHDVARLMKQQEENI